MKKIISLVLSLLMVTSNVALQVNTVFAAGSDLSINEVCTGNDGTVVKMKDGTAPDFIELYNSSDSDIDLSGYGVSDKATKPLKTTLPSGTTIKAKSYLVVYCSKSSVAQDGEILVALGLSASGESVFLSNPQGTLIETVTAPTLETNSTYAKDSDGNWQVTYKATPGAENIIKEKEIPTSTADPVFSKGSGFYDDAFDLDITSPDGATIYYTTDSSTPTEESNVYDGSLSIYDKSTEANVYSAIGSISSEYVNTCNPSEPVDKCTVVKAICVDKYGNKSNVITNTYFVGYQNKNSCYSSMPVVSITTDPDNLFGYENGIYVKGKTYDDWLNSTEYDSTMLGYKQPANYLLSGKTTQRSILLQYFDENGKLQYEDNSGIRVKGAVSRAFPKKSFNLYPESSYSYDFLKGTTSKISGNAITTFDKISLSSGSVGGFNHLTFLDAMTHELGDGQTDLSDKYEPCSLFIDGEYWGTYYFTNKLSAKSIASEYEVNSKDVLLIKTGEVEDGDEADISQYRELYKMLQNNDMSIDSNYEALCEKVDIQSLVDFMCMQIFINNSDWLSNNIVLWKTTKVDPSNPYADGKWRWVLYDCDYAFTAGLSKTYDYNTFEKFFTNNSTFYNAKNLIKNDKFKNLFINTFMDRLNTNLSKDNLKKIVNKYIEKYSSSNINDFQRWYNLSESKATAKFNSEANMLKTYVDGRTDYVTEALKTSLNLQGDLVNVTVQDSNNNVTINTIDVEDSYTGKYYTDTPVKLTAKDVDGYYFAGWEVNGKIVSTSANDEINLTEDSTIKAVYEQGEAPTTTEEETTVAPTTEEATTEAPTTTVEPTTVSTGNTFYYVPTQADEDAGYTYKAQLKVLQPNGQNMNTYVVMTKTDKTYNGTPVYSLSLDGYTDFTRVTVQTYSDTTWKSQVIIADNTTADELNNKIYVKTLSTLTDYTVDAESTFYYVPNKDDETAGYTYKAQVKVLQPNGQNMNTYVTLTKTDKTYEGTPVYSLSLTGYSTIARLTIQTYLGSTHKSQVIVANDTTAGELNNKMYVKATSNLTDYTVDAESTFYYVPNKDDETAGYTYKAQVKVLQPNGQKMNTYVTLTKTDKTYNGTPVYSLSLTGYSTIARLTIQTYSGTTHKSQVIVANDTTAGELNNKMYDKATSNLTDYTVDAESTFYYVPNKDDETAGYTYKAQVKVLQPNGQNMNTYVTLTKTDKTYEGTPVYSLTLTGYSTIARLTIQTYSGTTHKSQVIVANETTASELNDMMYVKSSGTLVSK